MPYSTDEADDDAFFRDVAALGAMAHDVSSGAVSGDASDATQDAMGVIADRLKE